LRYDGGPNFTLWELRPSDTLSEKITPEKDTLHCLCVYKIQTSISDSSRYMKGSQNLR